MKFFSPYLRYLKKITGSIAFLPSVISVLFVVFGIVFLYTEQQEYFPLLKSQIDFAIVKSTNAARNMLGILIGGVISLMVFSFSMVMVVLSQALSSLSPRVIPGLISDKRHQTVLGFYLGTLLYLFLIMINLRQDDHSVAIQLNVLAGIVCGISCLILFTYFIHTISQGIQVDVILEDIFQRNKLQLGKVETAPEEQSFTDEVPEGFTVLKVRREGYYNGFAHEPVIEFCQKRECRLFIVVRQGTYLYRDTMLGYISIKTTEEDEEEILRHFYLEHRISDDHYLYGFKYITEIGVKSLSPGINDPGTALKAINFLTVLIMEKMSAVEKNYCKDSENMVRVIFKPLDIETLIYHFYTPFRTYGSKDITVMLTLLRAFESLIEKDLTGRRHVTTLQDNLVALREGITDLCRSRLDGTIFNNEIERINSLNYFSEDLPLVHHS